MFRRLIISLAFRSLFLSILIAAIICTFIGPVRLVQGEEAVAPTSNLARRIAQYLKDPDGKQGPQMFQFGPEIQFDKNEGVSGARTSVAIDAFGNTYVAADGSSLALGEPQITLGRVYVQEYPRWAAAVGSSRLYIASPVQERLVVRSSDDGGRTNRYESLITRLTDPGASSGQGNLIANRAGTLYNVFTGSARNEIYVAKCAQPCERFITRRIFDGAPNMTVDHSYPVIALDNAGGLHVAFSDGQNVFVISSADGGATWREPAAVNNPGDPDTAIATSPWLFAGDSGRLGVVWLGAQGDTYYASTSDAFSPSPIFSYVGIGDPDPNANLPSATSDVFGDATIVFGHTHILRQIAGEKLVFGPMLTAAGVIKTETGVKRVSVSVRQDSSGSLTYLDEQRRLSLRSTNLASSKRADQKIAVSGKGQLQDGSEVSFTLVASDPSVSNKDFSIAMSNGYFAAGQLQDVPPMERKVQKALRRMD
jgi:hypothetical protein